MAVCFLEIARPRDTQALLSWDKKKQDCPK